MKPNYFTNQFHEDCLSTIKEIKKKGNPVEVQTTQALMGDQSKRKQLFTIKAKFSSFVSRCSLVWCRSRRFDCILLRSTGHAWSYKTWCSAVISCFSTALIGAFRSLLFHSVICSLGGPLSLGSPVCCGHPRFWNFYSTIPVDVVRVKSYMNCLFDSARDLYFYTLRVIISSARTTWPLPIHFSC